MIRKSKNLCGKGKKDIQLFSGYETDEETGANYKIKNEKLILQPRMKSDTDGRLRIEASYEKDAFKYFKTVMKRQGYSEKKIKEIWRKAEIDEIELSPPIFKKDISLDFSKLGLSAIKIAYEYTFSIIGEEYLDDAVAILFSRELKKNAYSTKIDINVSNELARFVTYPIYGTKIDDLLLAIKKDIPKDVDLLHLIFMIKQDGCLYCILHLCMENVITFAVKVTEKADNYDIKMPITLVYRDGTIFQV